MPVPTRENLVRSSEEVLQVYGAELHGDCRRRSDRVQRVPSPRLRMHDRLHRHQKPTTTATTTYDECPVSEEGHSQLVNTIPHHTIAVLSTASGLKFAFDPTAAQFGWKEHLSPWSVYRERRVDLLYDQEVARPLSPSRALTRQERYPKEVDSLSSLAPRSAPPQPRLCKAKATQSSTQAPEAQPTRTGTAAPVLRHIPVHLQSTVDEYKRLLAGQGNAHGGHITSENQYRKYLAAHELVTTHGGKGGDLSHDFPADERGQQEIAKRIHEAIVNTEEPQDGVTETGDYAKNKNKNKNKPCAVISPIIWQHTLDIVTPDGAARRKVGGGLAHGE
ncbi:hypothetical protein Daus18300_005739 [Diaporthe australafricana]|uniref:Uncharacterized protein n=1 Tax=Diaporthe australafricana TaxID=127596 RepID=A0ABR3WZK7_9PEZI